MVYPLTDRQSLSEINRESWWAFFSIEGFAGKRSLLFPPPPPSLVFFALAPFSARPECENSFSRSDISFGSYGNACYASNFRSHRSAWFPMLTSRCFSEFDTSVICHVVLILCLGSFLLVARYVLRLKALALEGQRLKYSVKIMLTLVLYWLIL